jgi:ankyrin repeat protein
MADFNSVDKNKDVNSVDTDGHTHLRDAMIQKHTKVAKVLLKASGR